MVPLKLKPVQTRFVIVWGQFCHHSPFSSVMSQTSSSVQVNRDSVPRAPCLQSCRVDNRSSVDEASASTQRSLCLFRKWNILIKRGRRACALLFHLLYFYLQFKELFVVISVIVFCWVWWCLGLILASFWCLYLYLWEISVNMCTHCFPKLLTVTVSVNGSIIIDYSNHKYS